jgi:hypothetical protein
MLSHSLRGSGFFNVSTAKSVPPPVIAQISASVSPPPLQRAQGQPPPIAAHGGLHTWRSTRMAMREPPRQRAGDHNPHSPDAAANLRAFATIRG